MATTKSPTKKITARKKPSQERSKEKVEQILAATQKLLADNGLEKLTTNHIAQESGMSVGSLYQYFPNKQAILYELYKRWLEEIRALLGAYDSDHFNADCCAPSITLDKIFDDICGATIESWKQSSYETELEKAMKLYPELQKMDRVHGKKIAAILANIWRRMGVKASDEELLDLGAYSYELYGAFESSLIAGCDTDRLLRWHKHLLTSMLKQYIAI